MTTNTNNTLLTCPIHKRQVEGYCQNCKCYLCSSCMFMSPNVHKGHDFLSLEELSFYLRTMIDENSELFKHEYCEKPSVNVRQAKNSLSTQTKSLIDRITKESDKLIEIIKKRRDELINSLKNNMDEQMKILNELDEKWKTKMNVSQQITKIQTDQNDQNVYENLIPIMKGISMLKEGPTINNYKTITDYNPNIKIKNIIGCKDEYINLNMDEFVEVLNNMFTISEHDIVNMEYTA